MNIHEANPKGFTYGRVITVGDTVRYLHNGNIYIGQVMQSHYEGEMFTICDPTNESEMTLWNAGFAVGTSVKRSQIY
jgi:hypothetical protein